jgi:hypothetical protein
MYISKRFTPSTSLATLALAIRLLPPSGITFPALIPLSTALYLASLALFVPSSLLLLLQTLFFPSRRRRTTTTPQNECSLELGYLSSWPTTFMLYVAFGGFAAAEGRVGSSSDRAFVLAVYVAWWAGAAWCAATVLYVLAVLLSLRVHGTSRTPGGRFAPLVGLAMCLWGVATVALVGGVLAALRVRGAGHQDNGARLLGDEGILSGGLAAPVVVVSICTVGAALFMAGFTYAVLLHELVLVTGWPPPEQTAAMFFLVAPFAQCAAALLVLADAAARNGGGQVVAASASASASRVGHEVVANNKTMMLAGLTAMPALEMMCVVLALLIGGADVVWLVFGLVTAFYRLSRRELAWNPSWNGVVAPIATLAILCILLATALGSPFFRIAGCVLIVFGLLVLVVNVGFLARLAFVAREKRDTASTA